jgi:hypothetical protein
MYVCHVKVVKVTLTLSEKAVAIVKKIRKKKARFSLSAEVSDYIEAELKEKHLK